MERELKMSVMIGRASAAQHRWVAAILGEVPIADLTNADAQDVIAAYLRAKSEKTTYMEAAHPNEVEATDRALGLPVGTCACRSMTLWMKRLG